MVTKDFTKFPDLYSDYTSAISLNTSRISHMYIITTVIRFKLVSSQCRPVTCAYGELNF